MDGTYPYEESTNTPGFTIRSYTEVMRTNLNKMPRDAFDRLSKWLKVGSPTERIWVWAQNHKKFSTSRLWRSLGAQTWPSVSTQVLQNMWILWASNSFRARVRLYLSFSRLFAKRWWMCSLEITSERNNQIIVRLWLPISEVNSTFPQ